MSKTTEPTPQEPLGDSEGTATSAVVGLDPVAFMTHHDDPMLFPTWDEAVQYCDDDESPISLFHATDVAKLQAKNEALKQRNLSLEVYAPVIDRVENLERENEALRKILETVRDFATIETPPEVIKAINDYDATMKGE